jgi:hypothetical protein
MIHWHPAGVNLPNAWQPFFVFPFLDVVLFGISRNITCISCFDVSLHSPFASVRQLSQLTHLPSTTVLPNRWDLWRVTFDWYHMLCQMRKRAKESICPGDYCECSKFSAIEHGMTSSPSTSLGFT